MRWDVTKITLEAHYVNAPSKTFALGCRSVSELDAEYYPDQRGGLDGSVVRSLREPRSLMVRGIRPEDLDALNALDWDPTELSFTDQRTGTPKRFYDLSRAHTQEPDAARFAIIG
jgi:hypothetical protein